MPANPRSKTAFSLLRRTLQLFNVQVRLTSPYDCYFYFRMIHVRSARGAGQGRLTNKRIEKIKLRTFNWSREIEAGILSLIKETGREKRGK